MAFYHSSYPQNLVNWIFIWNSDNFYRIFVKTLTYYHLLYTTMKDVINKNEEIETQWKYKGYIHSLTNVWPYKVILRGTSASSDCWFHISRPLIRVLFIFEHTKGLQYIYLLICMHILNACCPLFTVYWDL